MIGFLLRDLRGSVATRSLWVFCASLFLGIALISACAGLLQLVRGGLADQQRTLFGGDVQLSDRRAITDEERAWLDDNGKVSLLQELRTMLGTADGRFTVVEMQSVDAAYPLYGTVRLAPDIALAEAVAQAPDGTWGAVYDSALAVELGLVPGQRVTIGELEVELRAEILEQPDRSLRADVRGPPVIVDERALAATGLTGPMSLVDYDYRIRLDDRDPREWREALRAAFPDATWEVRTVVERGELVGKRLNQVASVLLLIGFSTLLIGGLGVTNGIAAYLQTKLRTLATLQSLGARSAQVAVTFIGQTVVVALTASFAGAVTGAMIAWLTGRALADRLPIEANVADLAWPTMTTTLFGVFAAMLFALPTLGRTLDLPPALLMRGIGLGERHVVLRRNWQFAVALLLLMTIALLLLMVPSPLIGLGFVLTAAVLLFALNGIVNLLRRMGRRLSGLSAFEGQFALRMAIAGMHRPGSALRPMLLSLGTALTLLVASSLVIAALLHTLNNTVPARAPALVFYDIQHSELDQFEQTAGALPQVDQVVTAPLVLGRLREVNGEILSSSDNAERAFEANDEHKLSWRVPGIDSTTVDRGAWWPDDYSGPPLVAMEDREADQLGLAVGDTLRFSIQGQTLDVSLAAIYKQATLETRFWFEAVFSPGVLNPFVTRHVGSAWLQADAAKHTDIDAMNAIGAEFPSVVTIRTTRALEAARSVLNSAAVAVALVSAVSLIASVLVMASVVAVNRRRQVHEASVLHAIGLRMRTVLNTALYEYALMGIVVSLFATLIGGLIGQALLHYWIELPSVGVRGVAPLVAFGACALCLVGAALWLARTLKATPAVLLRETV
ncbi:MAG: hypothetical protein KTR32_01000 [Granulosicoccus sp.]|nr:hypothetical protein [Granulosicoccus sp.]